MVERVSSLKTGIKYKDTPIGKIPVDWEVTTLGKIAYLEYGASLPEEKRKKGNVPVYGSNGIVGYHCDQLVDGPGIIIGRKGTVGAVNWVDENFWAIDTTYYITREQSKENLKWLLYLLSHSHLERLHITTGVPGLNRDEAHSLIIPIPPFPEQKKIAEILTTVDEVIEETTQIIEKTKELKKGMMQRLLTRGIGHREFKKTEIGEIPVEWEVVPLRTVSEINMGQSPPSRDYNEQGDGLPFYQGNSEFGQKYPIPQKWCNKPRKLANERDILISVRAPVGEINIAPHRCCIGRGIAGVNAKGIYEEFLYQSMLLHRKSLQKMAQGSTFEAINRAELSELLILLPPFLEQKKIAQMLYLIDDEIGKESEHKERLELLKKGLMQVLLTGRLRVTV